MTLNTGDRYNMIHKSFSENLAQKQRHGKRTLLDLGKARKT